MMDRMQDGPQICCESMMSFGSRYIALQIFLCGHRLTHGRMIWRCRAAKTLELSIVGLPQHRGNHAVAVSPRKISWMRPADIKLSSDPFGRDRLNALAI